MWKRIVPVSMALPDGHNFEGYLEVCWVELDEEIDGAEGPRLVKWSVPLAKVDGNIVDPTPFVTHYREKLEWIAENSIH